ncbi:hypothetical protein AXG55_14375 [Silvanigrella aquatica]|uniref:Uncharacterized protein n=1 Tax=Silvanigrella aquatica TaxID=1915309 RepID=A0A1L4D473_9BACT|nr:hypothetical protein AXG55_14375 [Silvanigrella aquatica]
MSLSLSAIISHKKTFLKFLYIIFYLINYFDIKIKKFMLICFFNFLCIIFILNFYNGACL